MTNSKNGRTTRRTSNSVELTKAEVLRCAKLAVVRGAARPAFIQSSRKLAKEFLDGIETINNISARWKVAHAPRPRGDDNSQAVKAAKKSVADVYVADMGATVAAALEGKLAGGDDSAVSAIVRIVELLEEVRDWSDHLNGSFQLGRATQTNAKKAVLTEFVSALASAWRDKSGKFPGATRGSPFVGLVEKAWECAYRNDIFNKAKPPSRDLDAYVERVVTSLK